MFPNQNKHTTIQFHVPSSPGKNAHVFLLNQNKGIACAANLHDYDISGIQISSFI